MFDRRGFLLATLIAVFAVACGQSAASPSPTEVATAAPSTAAQTSEPATAAPTPTGVPTVGPTLPAGEIACETADLKVSHGLIDGAAGSIFTEIVLVANSSCSIEASPSIGLQDKSGVELVPATPAGPGWITLVAGGAYTAQVRIANWCAPDPAFPLALIVWVNGDKLIVTGGSFPQDGMPGCLGDGGVALESTAWVAST